MIQITRRRAVAVTTALIALAASGVSMAGSDGRVAAIDKSSPKLAVGSATLNGAEVQGIVSAVQRRGRDEATLSVSVGGFGGGVDEERLVVGSRRPCSREAVGKPVFAQAMQDVFVTELVSTNGPLGDVRSVRIREARGSTTLGDVACSRFRVATQFLGTSHEGTGI
jgi:hypothetical protein